MRILHFTAGAANMYCGSCFRDNALAAALKALGHDIILQPIYTPTRTDEENVSAPDVLFGGISIYLQQNYPIFRHTPRVLDALWDSNAALRAAARRSIPVSSAKLAELTVSMLRGEDGPLRKEFDKLVAWMRHERPPEVINISYSLLIALAQSIKQVWDCPVCCTIQGEDLFLEGLPRPYRDESLRLIREGARWVDQFIAVSRYSADFMSGYLGIPRQRFEVVPIGINLDGYDGARAESGPFRIGYFARVAPEKGLHNLCEAYRILRRDPNLAPSRLDAAGYLGAEDRPYLEGLERQMRDWGLAGDFKYRGVLDREQKIRFLHSLDVLSVPSVYHEPKGMFLLEAMACGVPVVQPRHGAYPEIIETTGGGVLVEPGNAEALAEAIRALWLDPDRRNALGRRAWEGVRAHYSARHMASRLAEVYSGLAGAAVTSSRPGSPRSDRAAPASSR